ncbi:unnamed protein product [Orchesella dallaii]|uniref:Uncharacterized protein n=1 Tax=Orchesella dallaii TaxID=48710 RepID=A0ABP1QTS1_9HEXA
MDGGTSIISSLTMLSYPLSLSAPSSLLSSSSSAVALFLLSAACLLGHTTGAPKSYDYDIYNDGYDPYGPNVVKVDKVVDYYSKPQYAFGYEVDDYYNQLSHGRWEIRDGDVTQGQYRVLLPDGRIQIVSYIADKFGYRPTVEYIGKGAHPPPPPAYAHVKVPKILQTAPVVATVPEVLPFAGPGHHVKAPYGLGGPVVEEYPVKIKLNSFPVNGPLPIADPYAFGGNYGAGYGYGFDPIFAGSNNRILKKKRALLYDRTLFRKDVEKRSASPKKTSN